MSGYVVLLSVLLVGCGWSVNAGDGSVELDQYSFEKLISKFPAALVKFDVAFPYGEKHDAYTALARDARDMEELLVAEVGVKDYGEKDNEALARKYGATKDNFPVVKLFLRGKAEPVSFSADNGFTTEELRRFVRTEAGLYLSLPGCVRTLDRIAIKFMSASSEERQALLKEAEEAEKQLSEKDAASSKIYKLIMQRLLEKGEGFIETEQQRVKKLLAGKISKEKKSELNTRLNILQTFQLKTGHKDEL